MLLLFLAIAVVLLALSKKEKKKNRAKRRDVVIGEEDGEIIIVNREGEVVVNCEGHLFRLREEDGMFVYMTYEDWEERGFPSYHQGCVHWEKVSIGGVVLSDGELVDCGDGKIWKLSTRYLTREVIQTKYKQPKKVTCDFLDKYFQDTSPVIVLPANGLVECGGHIFQYVNGGIFDHLSWERFSAMSDREFVPGCHILDRHPLRFGKVVINSGDVFWCEDRPGWWQVDVLTMSKRKLSYTEAIELLGPWRERGRRDVPCIFLDQFFIQKQNEEEESPGNKNKPLHFIFFFYSRTRKDQKRSIVSTKGHTRPVCFDLSSFG